MSLHLPVIATVGLKYLPYVSTAYFRGTLGLVILILGLTISASAGGQVFVLACSLYVADLIAAEDRCADFILIRLLDLTLLTARFTSVFSLE